MVKVFIFLFRSNFSLGNHFLMTAAPSYAGFGEAMPAFAALRRANAEIIVFLNLILKLDKLDIIILLISSLLL